MIGTDHGEPGNGMNAAPSELAKESGSAGCVSTGQQIDVIGASTYLPNFGQYNQGINMNFGQAVEALKNGQKVERQGWNGKGMFLFLVLGSTFKVNRAPLLGIYPEGTEINYQPHIDMKTAQDTVVPWLASQSDVLAEDWQLVA